MKVTRLHGLGDVAVTDQPTPVAGPMEQQGHFDNTRVAGCVWRLTKWKGDKPAIRYPDAWHLSDYAVLGG